MATSARSIPANGQPSGAAPVPAHRTPRSARALRALTLLGALGAASACVEPTAPMERGSLHIVGGQMNPGDPAVVYLSLGGAACTGSVIAKRWVMTAKHCVTGTSAGWIAVYEGANPMGGDGRALASEGDIANIYLYDDGGSIENVDIALLESSVDLDVDPIPYSRDQNAPAVGDTAEAVGYGQSDDYNSPDGSKRRGSAEVIDNTRNEIWTTAQICFGDSGGPLFDQNGTVVGISSRITNDCSYAEDIFSNVGYFATWIAQYVPDEVDPGGGDGGGGAGGGGEPDPGGGGGGEPDPGGGGGGEPDPGGGGGGEPAPDPPPDDGDGPVPDPGGGGGGGGVGGAGDFGEECDSGDSCSSNACVTLPGGGGYCTESCSASSCPYGFDCSDTAQGAFCFLQDGAGAGGGGDGSLAPGEGPGLQATCSAAPGVAGGRAAALALAMLGVLAVWRRPRGRRPTA